MVFLQLRLGWGPSPGPTAARTYIPPAPSSLPGLLSPPEHSWGSPGRLLFSLPSTPPTACDLHPCRQSTHLSWPRPPGRPTAPKPTMAPQDPPLLGGVGAPPATSLCPAALGARRPPLHPTTPPSPQLTGRPGTRVGPGRTPTRTVSTYGGVCTKHLGQQGETPAQAPLIPSGGHKAITPLAPCPPGSPGGGAGPVWGHSRS